MQYQIDAAGKKTHVVLTIEEWEKRIRQYVPTSLEKDVEMTPLSESETPQTKAEIRKLIGSVSKEKADEWIEYINGQRREGR